MYKLIAKKNYTHPSTTTGTVKKWDMFFNCAGIGSARKRALLGQNVSK